MTIAFTTKYLLPHTPESDFIQDYFFRLAKKYPQQQFLYISNEPLATQFDLPKNSTSVLVKQKTRWLFNYAVARVLRKHNAAVVVTTVASTALRSAVPQCVVVEDLSFLHRPKVLHTAKNIVTVSKFIQQEIIRCCQIEPSKINVLYPGIHQQLQPNNAIEKESTKEKYTAHKEYFIYTGPIQAKYNITNLLKAFSFFKKRQKSNMQLVMASTSAGADKKIIDSLKTFKFKDDVTLLWDVTKEERVQLIASAYAMVYPTTQNEFALSPLEAMQCAIPVITSATPALQEICGDAALYVDPHNFETIADKMMLLFKDEGKRAELITKGQQQVAPFNWNTSIELLWETIQKTIQP